MSFEQLRTALALAFADSFLNEEEFLILYLEYEPKNPTYPYWEYDSFCLDNLTSNECGLNFRLAKEDIPVLVDYLHIPDNFVCSQGTRCSGVEGLCVLLKRLSYPCRYFDMIPVVCSSCA